jgi:hypothetical protein
MLHVIKAVLLISIIASAMFGCSPSRTDGILLLNILYAVQDGQGGEFACICVARGVHGRSDGFQTNTSVGHPYQSLTNPLASVSKVMHATVSFISHPHHLLYTQRW